MSFSQNQDDAESRTDGGGEAPPAADSQPRWQRNAQGFAFEEVLMSSRVYRIVAKDNSDAFSIIGSAGRTASWSMLSGLSLSEISHIGIQAIPIYVTDITNKEHYDFSPTAGNAFPTETAPDTSNHGAAKPSRRDRIKGLFSFRAQPPPEPEPEPKPTPTVFRLPLPTSIRYANVAISRIDEDGVARIYGYIPIIVAKTGVYLKEKATAVEDIFATTGNPVRMSELQTIFDSPDRYGKGLVWDGYTVHDAAGILLRYLKSLPEPIIPYHHYNSFVDELGFFIDRELTPEESSQALELAIKLVIDMPPLNRQLLLYILDMLHVFADKSAVNKMTALRLVSSFQPSILSGPPDKMDAEAHHVSASVAMLLVSYETEVLEAMDKILADR
uniref:Rho-GAP domain-containing protein n=2 Tax=Fusarium oxysporum TaxID=5507 RepID=A0A0D2YF04_FUSOF